MQRLHQGILIGATLLGSWLGMQLVHESGHVLGLWITGDRVAEVARWATAAVAVAVRPARPRVPLALFMYLVQRRVSLSAASRAGALGPGHMATSWSKWPCGPTCRKRQWGDPLQRRRVVRWPHGHSLSGPHASRRGGPAQRTFATA